MNQSISMERNTSYILWITQRLQQNAFCQVKFARSALHPTTLLIPGNRTTEDSHIW